MPLIDCRMNDLTFHSFPLKRDFLKFLLCNTKNLILHEKVIWGFFSDTPQMLSTVIFFILISSTKWSHKARPTRLIQVHWHCYFLDQLSILHSYVCAWNCSQANRWEKCLKRINSAILFRNLQDYLSKRYVVTRRGDHFYGNGCSSTCS